MYAGPGSDPMLAAAAAWDGLAGVLTSATVAYRAVLAGLIHESWLGPASAAMAAATAPYTGWLSATAAQAEQTARQAVAAAAAFETAFAMTVPPLLIAANRTQVMSLVATNLLGQNSPAIEAAQAQYAEMWAQDAAAMYSYAGMSAAESALTSYSQPPQIVDPAGPVAQAAAVAGAAGAGTTTDLQGALGQLTSVLPAAGLTIPTPIGELDAISVYIAAIGTGSFATGTTNAAVNVARPWNTNGGSSPGSDEAETSHADNPDAEAAALAAARGVAGGAVSAEVGQAATVGGLTVPHGWTMAAPEIKLAVESLPSASPSGGPTSFEGAPTGLMSGMALAGLAGRGLGGANPRGASGTSKDAEAQPKRKPTVVVIQKPPPASGPT